MPISRKFFFADSFPIFFSLLLLSFFSPVLFSLSSTLYPLSIHWKSFGLSPSKNLEMEHWSTRTWPILPSILHPKLDTFFLPEFGRYLTRTQVWMDLSLLCLLLIKTIWWRQKWWRHKWFNGQARGGGGSGIPVYPKKICQNTPKFPQYTQNWSKRCILYTRN